MDWFWHALWICVIVVPATVMWVAIVIELFRRRDLSGVARFGWLLTILVFPLIGSLVYLTVTWWRASQGHEMPQELQVTTVPTEPTMVSDLTRLDQLRRAGVLTEDEFAAGKRRVLEGSAVGRSGRHASEGVGS
jgi:hypothetical protein